MASGSVVLQELPASLIGVGQLRRLFRRARERQAHDLVPSRVGGGGIRTVYRRIGVIGKEPIEVVFRLLVPAWHE